VNITGRDEEWYLCKRKDQYGQDIINIQANTVYEAMGVGVSYHLFDNGVCGARRKDENEKCTYIPADQNFLNVVLPKLMSKIALGSAIQQASAPNMSFFTPANQSSAAQAPASQASASAAAQASAPQPAAAPPALVRRSLGFNKGAPK
jgi:hypothetical protein